MLFGVVFTELWRVKNSSTFEKKWTFCESFLYHQAGSFDILNTDTIVTECKADEFQCSNGLCISRNLMCNRDVNCLDGSDEYQDLCGMYCRNI